jgi:signal transduction histidine kinase
LLRVDTTINQILDIAGERVIVGSRIALAVGGLIATYLDPTQPARGEAGYLFLAGYVVFSLALLLTFNHPLRGRASIIAHVIEMALVCLIIIYTEGPSSPLFVYFTFVLLVAALRWQWQGALITGALLSIVLIALTTSAFRGHFEPSEIDRLILRNIYLIVASGLFAFFGDQLGRIRQQSERLQLARELHDGILQTLTAVQFNLQTAASAVQSSDQRKSLLEVGEMLNDEQRELRAFVEANRQGQFLDKLPEVAVRKSDMQTLIDHLKQLWNCNINFEMTPPNTTLKSRLGRTLKFIIAESVANAVTHGGAKKIAIAIEKEPSALLVHIKDDGSGISGAEGQFDEAGLVASGIGPRSIRERVTSLQGSFRLSTSAKGIDMQIELPISA